MVRSHSTRSSGQVVQGLLVSPPVGAPQRSRTAASPVPQGQPAQHAGMAVLDAGMWSSAR